MRVENVKGAVWTVDELEFYRRRPQRLQERLTSNSSSSSSSAIMAAASMSASSPTSMIQTPTSMAAGLMSMVGSGVDHHHQLHHLVHGMDGSPVNIGNIGRNFPDGGDIDTNGDNSCSGESTRTRTPSPPIIPMTPPREECIKNSPEGIDTKSPNTQQIIA